MYLTGIFRVLYFNGFPSLRTIHGLKLDDEPIYYRLSGIDGTIYDLSTPTYRLHVYTCVFLDVIYQQQ